MEPVTLIITALTVGATFIAKEAASEAIKDAYHGLKGAIKRKLSGKPQAEMVLAEHERDPETWEKPLEKAVKEAGIDQDKDVVETARRVMELIGSEASAKGKYNVYFGGPAQGTVIGDHSTVTQTFDRVLPEK